MKNGHIRVRAFCKKRCVIVILVSKVGGSHSFQVKTLIDVHKCGRIFSINNANKE